MLGNKTILILSPQAWGKMLVSKHHYAIELARKGNKVFFLNPPEVRSRFFNTITIEASDIHEGLFIVHQNLWFPYNLKFHTPRLFQWLMKGHIRKIVGTIGGEPDIVWSFDLGNLYPFKNFPAETLKIFHPVDEPRTKAAYDAAKGADIMFSVTREILAKYETVGVPAALINHGVQDIFFNNNGLEKVQSKPKRIGISGNFLRTDIDREVLLDIVRSSNDCVFECWGSYDAMDNNIGGSDDRETVQFINALRSETNVILHGPVKTAELVKGFSRMDAFLICYDVTKDQSNGTNYHKVMEYLATGKVIVSNNVTAYQGQPDLIQMVAERDSNKMLPSLFHEIVNNLSNFNDGESISRRVAFAQLNTYEKKIEEIDEILRDKVKK